MLRYKIKDFLTYCLFALITIYVSSCSPSYTQHGHLIDDKEYDLIAQKGDTKKSVLSNLGSPSSKDPLDENTWLYITSVHEKKPFKASKKIEQKVLAITFNDNDILVSKRIYTLKDGKILTPLEEKTVTYGKRTSLFREIFGNLGKYRPSAN